MIKENLKALRIYNKYTQEDIAEKLDVSRQSVAKWENGETTPDINKCKQLAELYDVTLDDLVNSNVDQKYGRVAPKGKHLFGKVKVGERGQIVIPKEAREVFDIKHGDNLLVLGDINFGLAILKADEINELVRLFSEAPIINDGEE